MALSYLLLGRRELFYLEKKHLPTMAILGGVAMAVTQVAYFSAISELNVAAAILLEYLSTVFIVVYSFLFLKERFSPLKLLAVILSLGGCFLTVGGYDIALLRMNLSGIFWGLTAAVCFAAYSLIGERTMQRYSPWTVLFYALMFASITCHTIYSPVHYVQAGYSPSQWMQLAYVAAFGTALPFGLYFVGIDRIRASRASITSTSEPVFAGIIAYLFLGETFSPVQILGGLLIIGAIALLQASRERAELAAPVKESPTLR